LVSLIPGAAYPGKLKNKIMKALFLFMLITTSGFSQMHKEIVMATSNGHSVPATGSVTVTEDVFLFRFGELIQTFEVVTKKEEIYKGLLMKSFIVKAKDGSVMIFVIDEKSKVISMSFTDGTEYILHTK
jgi:hypothetical protein